MSQQLLQPVHAGIFNNNKAGPIIHDSLTLYTGYTNRLQHSVTALDQPERHRSAQSSDAESRSALTTCDVDTDRHDKLQQKLQFNGSCVSIRL
jgi:hypothetical protein